VEEAKPTDDLDRRKLQLEIEELQRAPSRARWQNGLSIATTVATLILSVFVGILGFKVNSAANAQHDAQEYHDLISGLGSHDPYARVGAAVGLTRFMSTVQEKQTVALLGERLLDEPNPYVSATIVSTLYQADASALSSIVSVDSEACRRFERVHRWAVRLGVSEGGSFWPDAFSRVPVVDIHAPVDIHVPYEAELMRGYELELSGRYPSLFANRAAKSSKIAAGLRLNAGRAEQGAGVALASLSIVLRHVLSSAQFSTPLDLEGIVLFWPPGGSFPGARFSGAFLVGSAKNPDFASSDFSGANLANLDATGAKFASAIFSGTFVNERQREAIRRSDGGVRFLQCFHAGDYLADSGPDYPATCP
jgi:hypothetical protein